MKISITVGFLTDGRYYYWTPTSRMYGPFYGYDECVEDARWNDELSGSHESAER